MNVPKHVQSYQTSVIHWVLELSLLNENLDLFDYVLLIFVCIILCFIFACLLVIFYYLLTLHTYNYLITNLLAYLFACCLINANPQHFVLELIYELEDKNSRLVNLETRREIYIGLLDSINQKRAIHKVLSAVSAVQICFFLVSSCNTTLSLSLSLT